MKKTYIEPHIEMRQIHAEQVIASSEITSNNGIGYGGVDEEGELDPEVKEEKHKDVWDDDWSKDEQ